MNCPPKLTFNYTQFIALVPEYSDTTCYPEATLQAFWNSAINYVDDYNWGEVNNDKRQYALNLMTAHVIYISNLAKERTVPYLMQTANIDKVNVSLTPPPLKNQWQWWLSISPWGQQLFALLQGASVGGNYIGGSAVLQGFSTAPFTGGIGPGHNPWWPC